MIIIYSRIKFRLQNLNFKYEFNNFGHENFRALKIQL